MISTPSYPVESQELSRHCPGLYASMDMTGIAQHVVNKRTGVLPTIGAGYHPGFPDQSLASGLLSPPHSPSSVVQRPFAELCDEDLSPHRTPPGMKNQVDRRDALEGEARVLCQWLNDVHLEANTQELMKKITHKARRVVECLGRDQALVAMQPILDKHLAGLHSFPRKKAVGKNLVQIWLAALCGVGLRSQQDALLINQAGRTAGAGPEYLEVGLMVLECIRSAISGNVAADTQHDILERELRHEVYGFLVAMSSADALADLGLRTGLWEDMGGFIDHQRSITPWDHDFDSTFSRRQLIEVGGEFFRRIASSTLFTDGCSGLDTYVPGPGGEPVNAREMHLRHAAEIFVSAADDFNKQLSLQDKLSFLKLAAQCLGSCGDNFYNTRGGFPTASLGEAGGFTSESLRARVVVAEELQFPLLSEVNVLKNDGRISLRTKKSIAECLADSPDMELVPGPALDTIYRVAKTIGLPHVVLKAAVLSSSSSRGGGGGQKMESSTFFPSWCRTFFPQLDTPYRDLNAPYAFFLSFKRMIEQEEVELSQDLAGFSAVGTARSLGGGRGPYAARGTAGLQQVNVSETINAIEFFLDTVFGEAQVTDPNVMILFEYVNLLLQSADRPQNGGAPPGGRGGLYPTLPGPGNAFSLSPDSPPPRNGGSPPKKNVDMSRQSSPVNDGVLGSRHSSKDSEQHEQKLADPKLWAYRYWKRLGKEDFDIFKLYADIALRAPDWLPDFRAFIISNLRTRTHCLYC